MRTLLLLALIPLAWSADTAESILERARALHVAGNDPAALTEIYGIERQFPRHAPAWELKGDILMAQGNPVAARTAYREAARLRPEGSAPAKLATTGADDLEHQPWSIQLSGQRDTFSEDERGLEQEESLRVGYVDRPVGEADAWGLAGRVLRQERFDHLEHTTEVDAFLRTSPHWRLTAGGGYTPSAEWSPRWEVRGGVLIDLPQHLTFGLELDHRDYPERQVLRAQPSLRWLPCRGFAVSGGVIADTDHVNELGTTHEQAGYGRIESIWDELVFGGEYQAGRTVEPPQITEFARRFSADLTWQAHPQWAFTVLVGREFREIAGQQTTVGGRIGFSY